MTARETASTQSPPAAVTPVSEPQFLEQLRLPAYVVGLVNHHMGAAAQVVPAVSMLCTHAWHPRGCIKPVLRTRACCASVGSYVLGPANCVQGTPSVSTNASTHAALM